VRFMSFSLEARAAGPVVDGWVEWARLWSRGPGSEQAATGAAVSRTGGNCRNTVAASSRPARLRHEKLRAGAFAPPASALRVASRD
jgi:hypothetical protein